MIYKTLHRKLMIDQHDSYYEGGWIRVVLKD